MKVFGSLFEIFLFVFFLHFQIKHNYPNFYLDLTYKCIYLFSKLQIKLGNLINKMDVKLPNRRHHTIYNKCSDSLFEFSFPAEDAVYYAYSKDTEKPKTVSFVDYKFILVELFIENLPPTMICLKRFMLCDSVLKPNAIKYILNKYNNISEDLLIKYTIQIIDDSACSHQMNETHEIEFAKDKFIIREVS